MKIEIPSLGIEQLCKLFGKTRLAWYDNTRRAKDNLLNNEIIIEQVLNIRTSMPRIGVRKLYHLLTPILQQHQIKIGRDHLFDLLAEHKLLIRTRKRKAVTTYSNHWMFKYSNLVKGFTPEKPHQLWVSDITYIRVNNGFAYLSLITDAYSRKIMGYDVRKDLSSEGCINALQMALANRGRNIHSLIHHSDRGSQYCSRQYVDILKENQIAISMTNNGDPYENALAERVNGILKTEFNLYSVCSFEETCKKVKQSIEAYNQLRPHSSCNYLTPAEAHKVAGPLKVRWKNYRKPILTNP